MNRFTYKFQSHVHVPWLLTAISAISALGWLLHSMAPTTGTIMLFFILIAIATFGLVYNLTNTVRYSVSISICICMLLLLRLLGLRDLYYVFLLIGCVVSLELYFQKR